MPASVSCQHAVPNECNIIGHICRTARMPPTKLQIQSRDLTLACGLASCLARPCDNATAGCEVVSVTNVASYSHPDGFLLFKSPPSLAPTVKCKTVQQIPHIDNRSCKYLKVPELAVCCSLCSALVRHYTVLCRSTKGKLITSNEPHLKRLA
jgi:hypothetical protein